MKLRVFFLALFLIGALIGTYYFIDFLETYTFSTPGVSSRFWLLIMLAIMLQLSAHWLRAYKSKILLSPIRESDTGTLFMGLSVGYLFNLLLPFRAGELIRAYYVGDALAISKTTVFISIIVERIVDGLFLGMTLITTGYAIGTLHSSASSMMLRFGIGILLVSLILSLLIIVIRSENRRLLKGLYALTGAFNQRIANRLRLMAWSGIHGTKLMLASRQSLARYVLLTAGMWILYFMSVGMVVAAFFSSLDGTRFWYTIQSTYAGVSAPSGPGYLGTFHLITSQALDYLRIPNASSFSFINWIILVTPISLIGIGFLIRQRFHRSNNALTRDSLINKLHREADISTEFGHFLAAYFRGDRINKLLSNAELKNKYRLIRSFKGGSNAQTMLVWQDDEMRVKKITLPQFASKLQAQADWLNSRKHISHLPRVVAEETTDEYYYFDLRYVEDYYPFFDYMHKNSTAKSFQVLKQMLAFMDKEIYLHAKKIKSPKNLESYINGKVLGKVNDTALISESINTLLGYKKLRVNGVRYDNLLQVIDRIRRHKAALQELATYRESAIHGDLTIDNLIVSSEGDFLVIDPNDENQVSAPVVDYGKLYQSLHSGYEFLIQLKKCEVEGNKINFEDSTSHKYADVFDKTDGLLRNNLTKEEYHTILFHEAVHYCRMLTYRVNINPDTVAVFYGTAVKLFNEFIGQYD